MMMRRASSLAIVLVVAGLGAGRAEQAQFRATSTRVAIDVSVQSGNVPVSDLKASDFEVTDAGVKQKIELVALTEVPVDVTLIVDVSNSTTPRLETYRRDIRTIASTLRPIDRFRVLTMASEVREVMPLTTATEGRTLPTLEGGGQSRIFDGIAAALMQPIEPGRRHLILAFTDGLENRSILTGPQLIAIGQTSAAVLHVVSSQPIPEIIEPDRKPCNMAAVVRTTGDFPAPERQTVYDPSRGFVDKFDEQFRGEMKSELPPCEPVRHIARAAEATGGAVNIASELADGFKRIFSAFLNSYVVYFEPASARSAGWHDVTVKVTRNGKYTVRAKRGYLVGK